MGGTVLLPAVRGKKGRGEQGRPLPPSWGRLNPCRVLYTTEGNVLLVM